MNEDVTAQSTALSPALRAQVKGDWGWYAEDNSMAILYRGDDPLMGYVLSVSPCAACQKRNADKLWGRCSMPRADEAAELLMILNAHDDLVAALRSARNWIESHSKHRPVDTSEIFAALLPIDAALSKLDEPRGLSASEQSSNCEAVTSIPVENQSNERKT